MSGENSSGQYISKWERLLEALNRVTSAGITESDAKRGICNAIADGAIEIQLALGKHMTKHMTTRNKVLGGDVEIPVRLESQDFDFENSRPLKQWAVKRERISHLAGYWDFEWIELSRADVTKVLIPSGSGDLLSTAKSPDERSPRLRQKSQTGRERAHRVIRELYPDDVPDQATEPNANLCKRVAAKLKELGLPEVSDDTILRAAGRRRK